jgi:hypothetical protein
MIYRKRILTAAFTIGLALTAAAAMAGRATRVEDAIWGAGVTWDTILTPATFKQPPSHSVDLLFNFSMSGLTGQRAVSSNVPGDRYYNGGRWWVQIVVFTPQGIAVHDADGDGAVDFELTSAEEVADHLDLGHIRVLETSTYFECPLLRSR